MRIATWNINGIKARLEGLKTWLQETAPDVACLQEIKSVDEGFPREDIESLGYNVVTHGQKSFNGVAILSKFTIEDVERGLPGDDEDIQARYIEAVITAAEGIVRVASIYMPNGNPLGSEKFTYKLAWLERFERHVKARLELEEPLVLAGDYNIIPEPVDAKRPEAWLEDALYQPESRAAFRRLLALGLTDALRSCQPGKDVFSFWDYQRGAWQKNDGIRIDHLLLSPDAADRLQASDVDKMTRAWEKPSDHAPVWAEFSF